MNPVEVGSEVSRRYLSAVEREEIACGLAAGESLGAIGRRLGRPTSTISREVARNGNRPGSAVRYRALSAQRRADTRARRPKPGKLTVNHRLAEEVTDRLTRNFSPEQICHDLAREFPDDASMRVSTETIYRSIFVQTRGELRRELAKHLRTGRALRKPRGHTGSGDARGTIPGLVSISERPAEADDRAVPGHWEGDLIIGVAASAAAVGTLVERSTRFVILLHLPDGHGTDAVRDAIIAGMAELPIRLRRSLAWDRGAEMKRHTEITLALDLPVYFADPASPWQRGSNENTNGLLRQYFPKGKDLSGYPKSYLDHVADELNSRPRKTLNWDTPAQRMDQLLSAPPTHRVATTG